MNENAEVKVEKKYDKFIDNLLSIFFNKDKTKLYLLIIIVIGLILRIIAAINLSVLPDDMGHAVHAIGITGSGKLSTWPQSAPLWFYITDIFYSILGTTQIASRLASIIFGTLSIIIMFLFVNEFFGKKVGLIASFLLAISPYHIKSTVAEMDVTVLFMILFSFFLFVRGLNQNKKYLFLLSGIFLGLGILVKLYAPLFIFPLLLFALYKNYKKERKLISKNLFKQLLIFSFIVFIFCTPALIHNYLLYKDKGFMDFIFVNTLGIGKEKAAQYFSWDAGWGMQHDWKGFFFGNSKIISPDKTPLFLYALGYLFYSDILISILAIIGIFLVFKLKREYFVFFLFSFIIPFVYLASIMLLLKHYLFTLILVIPIAALAIDKIHDKIGKIRLRYILALILIFNLLYLGSAINTTGTFYSTSAIQKMISYKEENIPQNSFVLVDSRVYRGEMAWIFNDRNYIEASIFYDLANKELPGDPISTTVYFIECGIDDCGWGTIKEQPEFNQSMENLVKYFENNSKTEVNITQTYQNFYIPFMKKTDENYFKVYKMQIMLKPAVLDIVKSTHTWFLYPIGYDEGIAPIFDKYNVYYFSDSLLDKFAHLVLYTSIIFAFLSIPLTFYYLIKQ